jgi:hypothetical protein
MRFRFPPICQVQRVYFHAISTARARVIPGGMGKRTLSESDIHDLFISPAIRRAGWDPCRNPGERSCGNEGAVSPWTHFSKPSGTSIKSTSGPKLAIQNLCAKPLHLNTARRKNGGHRDSCGAPSRAPIAWSARCGRGIVGGKRMGAENCELRPIEGYPRICRAAWTAGQGGASSP